MRIIKNLRLFCCVIILFMAANMRAEKQPEAYRLYDNKGKAITYDQLVKALSKVDVVFVGEIHNCVITHWLELKLLESLYKVHWMSIFNVRLQANALKMKPDFGRITARIMPH